MKKFINILFIFTMTIGTINLFAKKYYNFSQIYVISKSMDKSLSDYEKRQLYNKAKNMSKSERFAWLLYNSSLDKSVKNFIIKNLDKNTQKEKEEIYNILLEDVRNTAEVVEAMPW